MDITKPIFYGNNKDVHPKDFLHRLEEYFAIKQTYAGEKIMVVGDCLKSAAFSWFTTIRFQLCNYEEFKKTFIDEYWSREIQIQVWSQCLNTKYIPSNIIYREHFAMWATKLRHLEVPRLSEQEIVKHIAKHYPGYLRAILISLPERTIIAAMKILGEEVQNQENPGNGNANQQNIPRHYNDIRHNNYNNRQNNYNNRGRENSNENPPNSEPN